MLRRSRFFVEEQLALFLQKPSVNTVDTFSVNNWICVQSGVRIIPYSFSYRQISRHLEFLVCFIKTNNSVTIFMEIVLSSHSYVDFWRKTKGISQMLRKLRIAMVKSFVYYLFNLFVCWHGGRILSTCRFLNISSKIWQVILFQLNYLKIALFLWEGRFYFSFARIQVTNMLVLFPYFKSCFVRFFKMAVQLEQ